MKFIVNIFKTELETNRFAGINEQMVSMSETEVIAVCKHYGVGQQSIQEVITQETKIIELE